MKLIAKMEQAQRLTHTLLSLVTLVFAVLTKKNGKEREKIEKGQNISPAEVW